MNDESVFKRINSIEKDYEKSIESFKNPQKLSPFEDIVAITDESLRAKAIDEHRLELSEENTVDLILSINNGDIRLKIFSKLRLLLSDISINIIIKSFLDLKDSIKFDLLEEFKDYLKFPQIEMIFNKINDPEYRYKALLIDYAECAKMSLMDLTTSFIDDEKKRYLDEINDKLTPNEVSYMIQLIKDEGIKYNAIIQYYDKLLGPYKTFTEYIKSALYTLNNDNLKHKLAIELKDKVGEKALCSIIDTISNKKICLELLIELKNYLINFSDVIKIIRNFDDQNIIDALKVFKDNLNENDLVRVINSISDEYLALDIIKEYKNSLSRTSILKIIKSMNNRDIKFELISIFGDEIGRLDTEMFGDLNLCTKAELPNYEQINNAFDEIMKEYDSHSFEPTITELKDLIGRQAKVTHNRNKKTNSENYLPSNLGEILASMSNGKSFTELQKDLNSNFRHYYSEMTNLILGNYNMHSFSSVFRVLKEKNITDEDVILNSLLSIMHSPWKEDLNGSDLRRTLKNVYITYNKVIKEMCNRNGISIKQLVMLNPDEAAQNFYYIFKDATIEVFKESLEKENTDQGGLLSQLCLFCFNIEEKNNLVQISASIEDSIKGSLLLTPNAENLIIRNRVKEIVNRLKQGDIDLNTKINQLIDELSPGFSGKRNLTSLVEIMKSDPRFKGELSKPITTKEKKSLPLSDKHFKIDKTAQRAKFMATILESINREDFGLTGEALEKQLLARLNVIKKNLNGLLEKMPNIRAELLMYEDLSILSQESMGSLLIFLDLVSREKTEKIAATNIDEFTGFADTVAILKSKYAIVLGETVVKEVGKSNIDSYYTHYSKKVSKRTYRTIPDVNGKFDSNGNSLRFRTYGLTDPEQIIAGVRMSSKIKTSCFKLDGAQSDTLKYITTSPHGIIVAIEDEKGNFLGRVYGFRIGNAVHFTRIYYNKEFDFKAAIKNISQAIINDSKEIDYVTCIPHVGKDNIKYMDGKMIPEPADITTTQERTDLFTDHNTVDICLVASRKGKGEVKFTRDEPTEKFYKKRKPVKIIDLMKINNEASVEEMIDIKKIIYCSDDPAKLQIINHLMEFKRIAFGEDFVIIEYVGRDNVLRVKPISINYGNDIEYTNIVRQEISNTMNLLNETFDHDLTSKVSSLGGC